MAATTATDLQVLVPIVGDYAPVFFDEVFTLPSSGVLRVDSNPGFPANGTNTYAVRGLYYTTTTAQTPTANTDMTVRALSSNVQYGVIRRRGDAFGLETAAALAGGVDPDYVASQIALTMANGASYDIEQAVLTQTLSGVFAIGGTLGSTNVLDHSGVKFDTTFITEAMALVGERSGLFDRMVMHPTMFWKLRLNELLTAQPNNTITQVQDAAQYATTYAGSIGQLAVFLNSRMPVSGDTYMTLISGSGANAPLTLGIERDFGVEYGRQILKAGGSDVWKYMHSHSPVVAGVSFTGTAPSGIGGVTDAELALSTNWTVVGGHTAAQTPAVAIHAKAE